MRCRHVLRGLTILLSVASTSCPRRTAVWIIPGSTLERLEFGVSNKRGGTRAIEFVVLTVYRCEKANDLSPTALVWGVGPASVDLTRIVWPTRIVYGVVPPGFQSEQGPESLRPGCYRAAIGGTGATQFEITVDGQVRETHHGDALDLPRVEPSGSADGAGGA